MDNQTRRILLERVKASGFPGSILDVFQNPAILDQFIAEQQQSQLQSQQQFQQQSQPVVAQTPQEQEQGLRPAHAAGNVGQSMIFPNVEPNQSFNTVGMKIPIDINKVDNQGNLVESYKAVPPGIQDLPTGPNRGMVIESPAEGYAKTGGIRKYQTGRFKYQAGSEAAADATAVKVNPLVRVINIDEPLPNIDKPLSNFDYQDYYDKANKYLSRDIFKGTTLTAKDIADAANEFYIESNYQYPLDLLLTQAQIESKLGKALKSKHNYFNVGNTDSGATIDFPSAKNSVWKYMDLMYNDYLNKGQKSVDELLKPKGFVNHQGNRYASNPDYENMISSQMQFINNYLKNHKTGGVRRYQTGEFREKIYTDLEEFEKANKAHEDSLALSVMFPLPPEGYKIFPYVYRNEADYVIGKDSKGNDIVETRKNKRPPIEPIGFTEHSSNRSGKDKFNKTTGKYEKFSNTHRPIYQRPTVKPIYKDLNINSNPPSLGNMTSMVKSSPLNYKYQLQPGVYGNQIRVGVYQDGKYQPFSRERIQNEIEENRIPDQREENYLRIQKLKGYQTGGVRTYLKGGLKNRVLYNKARYKR